MRTRDFGLETVCGLGPDDFVFCKDDGSPLNPDVLRRDVLYPTLDRIGIARAGLLGSTPSVTLPRP